MRAILKTVLAALVLCCAQASSLFAQEGLVPNAVERAALQAIYDDMNGAQWSAGSRWTLSRINSYPDSALAGINVVNGDIVSISFGSMGASGTLPNELNTLTQLSVLRIASAQLSATLPSLSNLTKLTELTLMKCNIPAVGYPSWLGSLTKLRLVRLQGNNFQGPLPSTIGQLAELEDIDLSGNDLSMANAIPNTFSSLDNVGTVNLTNCKLQPTSVATGLSGLNRLRTLILDSNPQFSDQGVFPDRLANLPALEILYLQANGFNSFPTSLTALSSLNTIYLGLTNYSNAARLSSTIDVLKLCSALRIVHLESCSIVSLPSDFDELTQVTTLFMDNNSQMNPAQCLELGYMPSLKTLYIQNCNLNTLPSSLNQSTSLRELRAAQNHLYPVPTLLEEIPALSILDLSSNGINQLPSSFGNGTMSSIKQLYLNSNGLTKLNVNFVKMIHLNILSIYSNKLGSDWPQGFELLSSMDSLNLGNNLIDALPNMTSWNELEYLDLNKNKLHGTVPAFVTNVTSQKRYVDISDNQYRDIAQGSHYAGTTTLVLDHNRFTFEELVPLMPASGYTYAPQDTTLVDAEREVYAYLGQTAPFVAYADTKPGLNTLYQWFRRREDGSDVAVSPQSAAAQHFNYPIMEQDQGATFYYRVTHGSLTQIAFTSRLQTLIIKCDILPTAVGFSVKKYACAMNFIPVSTYPGGCRTKAYSWSFGDNVTSIEKSPFHAYGGAGTFTVTMKIRYTCGVCVRDTVVTKPITFNPNEDFLMDSLLTIVTDQKPQVLAASAATFADAWPLQYEAHGISEEGLANGSDGVWRNEGTYVYKTDRKASATTDIAHDGTFDLDQFNWAMAEAEAVPKWIKANTMTEYSPYSYELENRDVLGVYTAALYDYGGHLPSANGVNMRHREMAFTSFEHFDSLSSGNWTFGNRTLPQYTDYPVYSGRSHIAIVKASQAEMEDADKVDVISRGYRYWAWFGMNRSNYIANDPIVCTLPYPNNPDWSIIVLRREPFTGVWNGKIRVRHVQTPVVRPDIADTIAHAGNHSLRITGQKTFEQPRLQLDSGKAYLVTAWAYTGNTSPMTPELAPGLAIRVTLRDKSGNIIQYQDCKLTGSVIEGWQQVRGVFTVQKNWSKVELTFNSGASAQAWFDDLRLHPEKGNMKTYVYDVQDYRLRAILDEENFGSFFYYDKEGNLYLTQKETEEGIKTISENVSYMTETH